ncbi:hypothetical protein FQN52_000680 [Onygenales sp. PD_12]|nr:hypothetical protein FQN52_000680 [Onygenales sp. PD_12]
MPSPPMVSAPRIFPDSGFDLIDPSLEIEEETLPTYRPEKYYPVVQGQVLNDRYQILAKLGYGVTSTVWLGRDLLDPKYVALKIYVTGQNKNHELDIYERLNSIQEHHVGKRFIRKLIDNFRIHGPCGSHVCLVHEPLGISASDFLKRIPGEKISLDDMKRCIRQLLIALDFLHSNAQVIHTDIQLKNLLLPAPDTDALASFEKGQIESPYPRKVLKDRTIYTSSHGPPSSGLPILCDFGEARFGDKENNEDIMPNVYRAPEVILKLNWDYKVDIWNVAMVAWDLVSNRTLFDGTNPDGIFDDRVHLAEMVALLGPPPPEFRGRSKLSSVFWDGNGKWKELAPIPDISLEGLSANVVGEDREGFLRWLRTALQWNPEDRPTAVELLFDEWLMRGLKSSKPSSEEKTG